MPCLFYYRAAFTKPPYSRRGVTSCPHISRHKRSQEEAHPGLHANGNLTLGENIADHGGLQVAFQALHNATKDAPLPVKDGFTPEQRFYIAYANLWAGNIREEQIRLLTQIDVHSLGELRVNAALPHIAGWYDAFGITENDPMYLAPEKRASIW